MHISVVIPSIRHSLLENCIGTLRESLDPHTADVIVVAHEDNEIIQGLLERHVIQKLIIDRGCPSRCLQRGIELVETDIFTWGTDDGDYLAGAYAECVDILASKPTQDGVIIKYTEKRHGTPGNGGDDGGGLNGGDNKYYISGSHGDLLLPGIPRDFKIAPVGMFYTEYWRKMGGIDCRYEHINMNVHDFCYRLQHDGGELHFSPQTVMHVSCDTDSNGEGGDHQPIHEAHFRNDLPLFRQMYGTPGRGAVRIKLDNWQDVEEVWRRFK